VGIVAEASVCVSVGVAQPQVRALATAMAHLAALDVVREIGGVGRLPSKVRRA
jgi:hypothetical protein